MANSEVFSALRPRDFLSLTIEVVNLEITGDSSEPMLARAGPGDAYVVLRFPPQSLVEQAFFEATPGFGPAQPDPAYPPNGKPSDPEPPSAPVACMLAGTSRLS